LYYNQMKDACLHEVFASIQGEGLWIGQRHIFVRFQGCDISCRYCDTPAAHSRELGNADGEFCNVQVRPGEGAEKLRVRNPVNAADLSVLCDRLVIPGPSRPVLSLTGGEPLLQSDFLVRWLPQMKKNYLVYLETSGIHDQPMKALADLVDIVSMDFKLPSATGLRPFWKEHEKFLAASHGKALFVKAVVTRDTTKEDVQTSARIIASADSSVPLVLQPAGAAFAPLPAMLVDLQNEALQIIADVRVIPQAHKLLDVP
jgi:7-carboxy-7-deazaguanine synthase